MDLRAYFESAKGTGILVTADNQGKVDAAVYSRHHFMDDGTLAFIMADRLTHHNIQSNPHAAYLFMEEGTGYKGHRLFLKTAVIPSAAMVARMTKLKKTLTENPKKIDNTNSSAVTRFCLV